MLLKSLQYDTAKRWADYLVNNTLTPLNQYVGFHIWSRGTTCRHILRDSADGLTKSNMTNLAIKGIIGVKAMAEISRATQHDSDAQQYDVRCFSLRQVFIDIAEYILQSRATALAGSWLPLAESSDQQHLLGQYGDQSSSAMLYNIYADLLLNTSLISQDVSAQVSKEAVILTSPWSSFFAGSRQANPILQHLTPIR